MKFTNKRIIESYPALQQLGAIELPVKISFEIGRILRRFHEAHELFQEQRNKLLDKHAERDESGRRRAPVNGNILIADPLAFDEDLRQLLDCECEIGVSPVALDRLGDIKLPAGVLACLDWLITA
jgi:hypothetical protein